MCQFHSSLFCWNLLTTFLLFCFLENSKELLNIDCLQQNFSFCSRYSILSVYWTIHLTQLHKISFLIIFPSNYFESFKMLLEWTSEYDWSLCVRIDEFLYFLENESGESSATETAAWFLSQEKRFSYSAGLVVVQLPTVRLLIARTLSNWNKFLFSARIIWCDVVEELLSIFFELSFDSLIVIQELLIGGFAQNFYNSQN